MFGEETEAEDGTRDPENAAGAEADNHKNPLRYN